MRVLDDVHEAAACRVVELLPRFAVGGRHALAGDELNEIVEERLARGAPACAEADVVIGDEQRTIGKGAAEAWQGEVAERLKATWIEAGRDGIELQRQIMPKITNVMKSAEKLRKLSQLRSAERTRSLLSRTT